MCGVGIAPRWFWLHQDVCSRGAPLPQLALQHDTALHLPPQTHSRPGQGIGCIWALVSPRGRGAVVPCEECNLYEDCCSHETKEAVA